MQMVPPRGHGLQTFLLKSLNSKTVQFLLNLLLDAINIAIFFAISFLFDYCLLWVIGFVFDRFFEQGVLVGDFFRVVQTLSLYGTMISYFLTLTILLFLFLRNYKKVLWKSVGGEQEGLKARMILQMRDTVEAIRDFLVLLLIVLVFIVIPILLKFLLSLFPSSAYFLQILDIGTAGLLAAGLTCVFIMSICRFVLDIIKKAFGKPKMGGG